LKNANGKTRVRVFLLVHNILISQKEKLTERKTGTPVFPLAFFQTACDSAEAISRSRARRCKKNAIREDSRRFAVKKSHVPASNHTLSELNPHKHRVTPILRKIRSKNKKKKKDYSAVSFFGRSGFTYVIS
jgi:hypothetical protein